ncbi:MAG: class I tRNA ligase family protein [Armatimonadetes bacterium]|nr:class I tRNA ligase family protein [Armatimonadota bacterium]
MLIRKFDPAQLEVEFNQVHYQDLYPWDKLNETPFGASWAEVRPGGHTMAHDHPSAETFIVFQGRGSISVKGETHPVAKGDVIYLPPGSRHTLKNEDPEESLIFMSLYWWWDEQQGDGLAQPAAPGVARRFVMPSPPTSNGKLHLGHLAGPYLGADLYRRFSKMRGIDAFYVSCTDDYQSYVVRKAAEDGVTPEAAASRYGKLILDTLRAAGIEPDLFLHPHRAPRYGSYVQQTFQQLYESGKLVAQERECLYCDSCKRYLFDGFVVGTCPSCGEFALGDMCDGCSRPVDPARLGEPSCAACENPASIRTERRLVFPLGDYREALSAHYRQQALPPRLGALVASVLRDGPDRLAVSQISDWGLSVPMPGFEGQVISAWFETALAPLFLSEVLATMSGLPGGKRAFWADPRAEVVQFFGVDNSFFVTVQDPAVVSACEPGLRLPTRFVVNEFLLFDEAKFSSSRGHALWADELLEKVPSDLVRFYLCHIRPENRPTTFDFRIFRDTIRGEILEGWQGWLKRLGRALALECQGMAPPALGMGEDHHRFQQELCRLWENAGRHYEVESFSPQRVTRLLCELVRVSAEFGAGMEWLAGLEERAEERRTALALELMAARTLALMAAPIMPSFAAWLWKALGYDGPLDGNTWGETPDAVPAGQRIRGLTSGFFPDGLQLREEDFLPARAESPAVSSPA